MYAPPVTFIFSAFFVSLVSAKLVHLCAYASTIPIASFVFYLPTFFLPDFFAVCIARLFLRPVRSVYSLISSILGSIVTLFTLGGAASQLGFYCKTGGELVWHEAKSYATDKDALKVLLSGSGAVLACAAVILVIAWFVQNIVFRVVGDFLGSLWSLLVIPVLRMIAKRRRARRYVPQDAEREIESASQQSINTDRPSNQDPSEAHMLIGEGEKPVAIEPKRPRCGVSIPGWIFKAITVVFFAVTVAIRPHKPYDYMSITLPVSILDVFRPEADHCAEQRRIMQNPWPFPNLLSSSNWRNAKGDFKGWAPGRNSDLVKKYRKYSPKWLPKDMPRGFWRWNPDRFDANVPGSNAASKKTWQQKCPAIKMRDPYYNPVDDPLKISNLDSDVLEPLQEVLGNGTVKIKNVVFVLMESLRQELFPLREGSDIYQLIMQANEEHDREAVNARLANLTPHIEKITGLSGNFTVNGSIYDPPRPMWDDKTEPGFGGINVVGGFTTATMSTKSFAVNHCGAWPMPVEKFDEADTSSYQPCLPQILDLFNRVKENTSAPADDFRDQEWYPALFESMTEQYDRQEIFDQKIGFKHIIARKELKEDASRYNASDPMYKPVNYFGFPEPVLKPYIRDYVTNATANNKRIFMSHFTTGTHHAWDTPQWFNDTDYLPTNGVKNWHKDFNKYLNTIRFHDAWMGEMMQLLDDLGISNETLVVFAGDHGQAFKEDYHKTGTYEVGHISDFRVPISFRHPHLPRIQYEANATTLSVLPTILDLLINTGSLNKKDTAIASDLVQDYEGQSLIRPYKTTEKGRRAWNFAVINSGAGMLAVTSADVPWRLVMPLEKVFEYTFTDLKSDPMELRPISAWSIEDLAEVVGDRHGPEAATWTTEAKAVARWWSLERQRLWGYHLGTQQG